MSERTEYPPGAHCWVDTLQPDPEAALEFYGPLFGWEFAGPGPGPYYVARLDGRDVAGIGALPEGAPFWATYIRVESAEAAGGIFIDASPAGRIAVVSDPAGAVFGAWEPLDRAGAQLVNEPSTWTMSSLHTTDPEGAVAYYGERFGWQPEPLGPITLFRLPGYVGGEPGQALPRDVVAVMAPPDPSVPNHWNVNFRVADADAFVAHASELGATILMAPMDTPGFRNAVIADPAGAVFSISQHAA
jgi:predicted enzyme related to lactoylglutathione lyase